MRVEVSLSFVGSGTSLGGMLVSSRCPCMMAWIAPLLVDMLRVVATRIAKSQL